MSLYTGHRIEDHEGFIFDQLLPLIVSYVRTSDTPAEVIVMAAWLSLTTILQAKGLSRDTLTKALDAALLSIHEAPGGLH